MRPVSRRMTGYDYRTAKRGTKTHKMTLSGEGLRLEVALIEVVIPAEDFEIVGENALRSRASQSGRWRPRRGNRNCVRSVTT